jgi:hypothetical protein
MKKLFAWIKALINPEKLADMAIDELGDFGEQSVEKMYAVKPKTATALVQSLYSWIPFAAEAAAKTDTKIDDHAVDEVRKEVEVFAAKFNIDLVDLDAPAA